MSSYLYEVNCSDPLPQDREFHPSFDALPYMPIFSDADLVLAKLRRDRPN